MRDLQFLDREIEERLKLQHNMPLRVGDLCPQCEKALVDYDGFLNLTCPRCDYSQGSGGFS